MIIAVRNNAITAIMLSPGDDTIINSPVPSPPTMTIGEKLSMYAVIILCTVSTPVVTSTHSVPS